MPRPSWPVAYTSTPRRSAAIVRSASPQLDATVAAQRSEGVAGEAFGVEPHEHVVAVADVAQDHRHVDVAGGSLEGVDLEHAVRRRQWNADRLAGDQR